VILCGDFNCRSGSVPYGLAGKKMRDAAVGVQGGSFTSTRPLGRIDHVFVTPHFATIRTGVVRNSLSRVSSDRFPLIADLRVQS